MRERSGLEWCTWLALIATAAVGLTYSGTNTATAAAPAAVSPTNAATASGQGSVTADKEASGTSFVIWDVGDSVGSMTGLATNPKRWKFRQSCLSNNNQPDVTCDTPIGSAEAADPGLDDSSWRTIESSPPIDIATGPNVANHYRKTFTLADTGFAPYQVVGIRFSIHYDDTAAVYLNGTEVYRSVRGNLDPDYDGHAKGSPGCFDDVDSTCDIPHDVSIPFGGLEFEWTEVPNYLNENSCQAIPGTSSADCREGPYDGPNPPAVPVELLDANGNGTIEADEISTWGVTVWNRQASTDARFDHSFSLLIDESAAPASQVKINEVAASNDTSWLVDLDGDGDDESPDWLELHNTGDSAIDVGGWTLKDGGGAIFTLPPYTMEADEYLVIAANDCEPDSGTGSCTTTDPMQANFKISSRGEALTLTRDSHAQEDALAAFPDQFTDGTWGLPNDSGDPTYLDSPTPGEPNSGPGSGYDPVLRLLPDQFYNSGETISVQIEAFDPDGNVLDYSISGVPNVTVDDDGWISGTATGAGTHEATIKVSERDDPTASVSQSVTWRFISIRSGGTPLVLNEYNAVTEGEEIAGAGGSEPGNGGDWFEFLTVDDGIDLRGWSIEFYDRKGSKGQLRKQAKLTFADTDGLSHVPAGTLVVIGEELHDDLGFDPFAGDWTIEMKVDNLGNGTYFHESDDNEVFNSTRSDQMVLIRDKTGAIRSPLVGETDAWDQANGGVSGQEVMNLCVDPTPGVSIKPATDYKDNGNYSTRGGPNRCVWTEQTDPNDPNSIVEKTHLQDFASLRSDAALGRGDVDCDSLIAGSDILQILQLVQGSIAGKGSCYFGNAGTHGPSLAAADVNGDSVINLKDAWMLARCVEGTATTGCPTT